MRVCAWAQVSAAPHHSWLVCRGVCVFVCALRLYPATPCWGVRCGCVCLGSGFRCALPLLAGVLGCLCVCLRAPLARVGAPRLVRSGRSRCSGGLPRRRGAFRPPGGLRPRIYWAAARGKWRPARNQALCACCWPGLRQGLWSLSASYPFRALQWGCPWRVPLASVLGCMRCDGWRVWTRSLTPPVSGTARLSTGNSASAPGLFRVDADTAPFGSEDATPGSRASVRVRALLGRVGRAGLPGAFWCASPFPVAALSFFFVPPPPGSGYPICCVFFSLVCAPPFSPAFRVCRPRVPWALASCAPPRLFFTAPRLVFFSLLLRCVLLLAFFFPLPCLLLFFLSPSCGAGSACVSVAVGCAGVCSCWRCGLWCVVCFAWCCVACLCLSGFSRLAVWRGVAPGLVGLLLLCSAVACCCVLCWVFLFFFALFLSFPWWAVLFWSVWCSAVVRLAVWPGPVALRSCAGFCCAVPFGALTCRGASLGSVLCCLFLCGAWVASCLVRCCGVLLCSVCPWARCFVVLLCCLWSVCCRFLCRASGPLPFRGASCVVLCGCACAVALCAVLSRLSGAGWCCVLLPVVFWCLLLGLAVLCCLPVAPGVVFQWCCPCLAAWLAALWFDVVCLGALLPCVVFCGVVPSSGGVLSCSAVCSRRCLCLLFVSCRCAFCCVCPGVLSCGWSACCGALLPCVVSCGAVLLCGAALSRSGVFLRCCVCLLLLFSFQNAAKLVKKKDFF